MPVTYTEVPPPAHVAHVERVTARPAKPTPSRAAVEAIAAVVVEFGAVYNIPKMYADSVALWSDSRPDLVESSVHRSFRLKLEDVVPRILADDPAGIVPAEVAAYALSMLDWDGLARVVVEKLGQVPASDDLPWPDDWTDHEYEDDSTGYVPDELIPGTMAVADDDGGDPFEFDPYLRDERLAFV
jgi:hypothetical protein